MTRNPQPLQSNKPLHEAQTERLRLTALTPEDAAAMLAFMTENRAHLMPWSPPATEQFYTLAFWQQRTLQAQDAMQAGTELRLVMRLQANESKNDDSIIGTLNLTQIFRGPFHSAMLGYQIAQRHEGKGLMSEAIKQTISIAFDELKLHRLQAAYATDNARSARVLQKHGFEVIGTARRYLNINGQWRDHIITQLINDNFADENLKQ